MQFNFRQGISIASTSPPFIILNGTSVNLYATRQPIILNFAHGNSNYLFYEYYDIPNAWNGLPSGGVYYIYWDLDTVTAQRSFNYTLFNPFIFQPPTNPQIGQMYFDQGYTKWYEWNGVTWSEKIRIFAGMIYNNRTFSQNFLSQVNIMQLCEAGEILFDLNHNPVVIETANGFEFLNSISSDNNKFNGLNNYKFSRVVQNNGVLAQTTLQYQCLGLTNNGLVTVNNNSNIPVVALSRQGGNAGDIINITTNDFVEDYSFFKFEDAPGTPLYVDENSFLTTYAPISQMYQELGYVVSPFKIYFRATTPVFNLILPTVSVSITPSMTPSISITPSITPTLSLTPSISPTNSPTITPTQTVTPSFTPTQTVTSTINASPPVTPTVTPTNSVSISLSATVTPTNTVTPTFTPSNTVTPTITPTNSITPTNTATPSILTIYL